MGSSHASGFAVEPLILLSRSSYLALSKKHRCNEVKPISKMPLKQEQLENVSIFHLSNLEKLYPLIVNTLSFEQIWGLMTNTFKRRLILLILDFCHVKLRHSTSSIAIFIESSTLKLFLESRY
jgi:hypothetical protein